MKIHARNTFTKKITAEEAKAFLDHNHDQKSTVKSGVTLNLGLFDKKEKSLIGLVQFCYPRTSKTKKAYSLELLRMAFLRNVRVPGGASKMIKNFIKDYRPSDFFTYQDTTGENTKVYEYAGMSLVKDGLKYKKQYVVAPGKTLNSASRQEALGLAYATRYGPDRILGTKIGEVFREDGTRKGNREIFLEELGWHIEETTGDSIYEWIDPNRTYYTYKITATDSEKYYYGVSHVKIADATVDDCLNDGYMGSGGRNNKFSNWKDKHKKSLIKEVVSTYPRKAFAYESEKSLVGDLWKTDRKCLNSTNGGKGIGVDKKQGESHIDLCSIHGETKHLGSLCLTCRVSGVSKISTCKVHGETTHFGSTCMQCVGQRQFNKAYCEIHKEETTHRGVKCLRCHANEQIVTINCKVHGLTKHKGDSCLKCRETISLKICPNHGKTKHMGDTCYKCIKSIKLKQCSIHGESTHNGNQCYKCLNDKTNAKKNCLIHGESSHVGDSCLRCVNSKNISESICSVHGKTKYRAGKCARCISENSYSTSFCEIHGETKFLKGNCRKCMTQKMFTTEECEIHGETKHQKGICIKCRNSSKWTIETCSIHGSTKHNSGKCSKCKHKK